MTQRPDYLPADYSRIAVVDSADALTPRFTRDTANCKLFPRALSIDFNPLAAHLDSLARPDERAARRNSYDARQLTRLMARMPHKAQQAAQAVLRDMESVKGDFFEAQLKVVHHYAPGPVYDMHADPGNIVMCGYAGPVTEYMRNDDIAHSDVMGLGAMKYAARPGAQIHTFRTGDIWVQAGTGDMGPEGAFAHRAPPENGALRLFLMGLQRRGT